MKQLIQTHLITNDSANLNGNLSPNRNEMSSAGRRSKINNTYTDTNLQAQIGQNIISNSAQRNLLTNGSTENPKQRLSAGKQPINSDQSMRMRYSKQSQLVPTNSKY